MINPINISALFYSLFFTLAASLPSGDKKIKNKLKKFVGREFTCLLETDNITITKVP